jgi:predicted transcriptional regulator
LLKYFGNKKSDDELAKLLKVSRSWVNRIRTELKEKGSVGNDKLNNLIISNKTYEVYEALLACDGLKSNLDIAKQLRPKADFTVKKTKESLTDKVSRVRRQLSDAKLIKEYNTYKKTVNIADVRERLEKALISNRGVKI